MSIRILDSLLTRARLCVSNNVVVGQMTVTNLPINWVNYRLWNTNDVTTAHGQ